MSDYRQNIEKVKKLLNVQRYYESVGGVLSWDFWNSLPIAARPYMSDVGDFLSGEAQKHLVSDETRCAVEFFREFSDFDYENDYHRGAVRSLTRRYDSAVRVPIELKIELGNFCRDAQMVWQECHNASDWQRFKPYVEKQFELKKRIANALDPDRPSFDVLVDRVDEGLTVQKADELFAQLGEGIAAILPEAVEKSAGGDTSCLKINPPKDVKMRVVRMATEALGFDTTRAVFGERMHPVCAGVGPRDSRPNTNYDLGFMGLISMMHECGHGFYNYNSSEEAAEWGLFGGLSGGFHESQSRFYENMVGKSRAFWQYFYPIMQRELSELKEVDLDTFYRALIKVQPSLRRVGADELTYNLHLIIRFGMEKDYFEGKIRLDDLEQVWNQRYKEYLGIEPQSAKEGILQDVHWASGHVGYFQSYTLGDLYAGQFRAKLLRDIPDVYGQIALGDMSGVNEWTRANIHQYGRTYLPDELLMRVTGEPLQANYCLDYLREKYL